MSLSAAYEALAEDETDFPQCKTCTWYKTLAVEDKTFFDKAVVQPGLNVVRLLRACKAQGLQCVDTSFRNHVREHHNLIRNGVTQ